ncbi:hypothetical protein Ciccas_004621 [Cichlidogyrus casuarinus]|uniref:DOP1-like TPR domain-containing protein n=1 Tax=Cichlidogyrus casuarinus TaxID=1844966 RepID=A0ABD2QB45_9PLAT
MRCKLSELKLVLNALPQFLRRQGPLLAILLSDAISEPFTSRLFLHTSMFENTLKLALSCPSEGVPSLNDGQCRYDLHEHWFRFALSSMPYWHTASSELLKIYTEKICCNLMYMVTVSKLAFRLIQNDTQMQTFAQLQALNHPRDYVLKCITCLQGMMHAMLLPKGLIEVPLQDQKSTSSYISSKLTNLPESVSRAREIARIISNQATVLSEEFTVIDAMHNMQHLCFATRLGRPDVIRPAIRRLLEPVVQEHPSNTLVALSLCWPDSLLACPFDCQERSEFVSDKVSELLQIAQKEGIVVDNSSSSEDTSKDDFYSLLSRYSDDYHMEPPLNVSNGNLSSKKPSIPPPSSSLPWLLEPITNSLTQAEPIKLKTCSFADKILDLHRNEELFVSNFLFERVAKSFR